MSSIPEGDRRQHGRSERPDVRTGQVKGDFQRVAREHNESENSISVNLTEKGVWEHNIEGGDTLTVVVCENGIFITNESE